MEISSILKKIFRGLLTILMWVLFIVLLYFAFSFFFKRQFAEIPAEQANEAVGELPEETKTTIEEALKEALEKSRIGGVAYAIPSEMQVGKEYEARAIVEHPKYFKRHIAKRYLEKFIQESKKQLEGDDPNFVLEIDSLVTYEVMKMQLIDPSQDHFIIKKHISEEEQVIDSMSRTEWRWKMIPLKKGNQTLIIKATAKIKTATGTSSKDIVLYSKSINVKANIPYTIWDRVKNHWQWVCSVLIIPIFYWLGKKILTWWRKRNDPQSPAGFRR